MKIYLYLKTHNDSGLKYLGKTIQDPFKYKGSGTRWLNHLRKHGNNVTTEILKECYSEDELKEWGIYYSNLWNIVESGDFANIIVEQGDNSEKKTRSLKEIYSDPEWQETIGNRKKEKLKGNPGGSGTILITDGIKNSRIKKDQPIPEGWRRGNTLSAETKEKMSLAKKGSKNHNYKEPIILICKSCGSEFTKKYYSKSNAYCSRTCSGKKFH